MSEFATRGSSKERVVEALRNPRCECKNRCRVPLRTLLKVVVAFWMLTKPTQDSLLWSLQHEAGSNKRKEWFIQGSARAKNILFKIWETHVSNVLFNCYSDPQHNSDMRSVQDIQCAGSHGYICWELANNASQGAKLLSGGRTSAPWVALVEPRLEKRLKRLCIKWYGVNIVRFGLFSDQLSLPFTLPHSGQSAPPAIKTASVRAFMIHMYFTASEPMPTSWLNFKSGTSS